MDIKSYLAILRGNRWVIITTSIVTLAVVIFLSFTITPTYITTTTLRIATSSTGVVGYSDYMYADRLMNTYTKLATSRPVLDELGSKLNITILPKIEVKTISNTELIIITVESSNPTIAKDSANALAEILIIQGRELYSGGGKSVQEILSEQLIQAEKELKDARQEYDAFVLENPKETDQIALFFEKVKLKESTYTTLLDQYDEARLKERIRENIITVVEPAIEPLKPSKPNKLLNISLGFIVGLIGGIGLAFLFENLGTKLYTSKQIESVAEINIIGKIPALPKKRLFRLLKANDENMNTSFKEAFRRLHIQIATQNPKRDDGSSLKTILITSSEPGEGKSIITFNLAKAIAQSGKKVIIIDCDLHIPKQHIINGFSNEIGLSTVLNKKTNFIDTVQKTQYPGMHVLTSGPIPPNPEKLLGSTQMKSLIKFLSEQYYMVILDTPALLSISDSISLIPIVEGILLVARRNVIREEALREACKQLVEINGRMLGLVVNEAERITSYYYDRNK
ncbi:MAG: polysaccharide biosynthesis tyrosine autokinase [Anaerolineaceae bacterium]|nr:polysaccharide biosynthesis tyrosine autokinase [Anaerolineaceae bacterium]